MSDPKKAEPVSTHKAEPVSGDSEFDPKDRPGYQEYPKVIHPPGGPDVTVTSAEDEAEKMKGPASPKPTK